MLLSSKNSGDNSSKEGQITLWKIDFSLIFIALEKKLFISYKLEWLLFELVLLLVDFPFALLEDILLSIFFFLLGISKLTKINIIIKTYFLYL